MYYILYIKMKQLKHNFTIVNSFIENIKENIKEHFEKNKLNTGPKKINFNYTNSINYNLVQKQLSELIQIHLTETNYQISHEVYKNGYLNFTWFIRDDADVFMSHGAADKNYFWTKKNELTGTLFINNFKFVLVPGLWMKRRMIESKAIKLNPSQIIPVGWPRIDAMRTLQKEYVKESPNDKITLLWAPTHDFMNSNKPISTSSYPEFENYAKKLKKTYNVLYSLHPRNRTNKEPTIDKLLNADVVISDYGTMVYEAWALGKPVIFPRWILKDEIIKHFNGSTEAYIFKNRIGYHPNSYEEMLQIIKSGPVVDQKVHDFMDEYLDNYRDGNSAKKIADTLLRLSENNVTSLE
jgi:CDP-glycerol glycerophosphotransferase (TagB/SpsB family)